MSVILPTPRRTELRTLDQILAANGLDPQKLPPLSPAFYDSFIEAVGPIEETFSSAAVYLSDLLRNRVSVKVKSNDKTYEYGRFAAPTIYEIPVLKNPLGEVSLVLEADPNMLDTPALSPLFGLWKHIRTFANNGLVDLHKSNRPLYDALTGLPTRATFEGELHYSLKQYGDIAVALADLDHFKQINDTHGHLAGDDCLKAFASYIRSGLRESDICGRWGGEEITIGMLDCSKEDAILATERIRSYVERQARADFDAGRIKAPFTVTIGLAHTSELNLAQEAPVIGHQLTEIADDRLYRAKHGHDGLTRNTVSAKYRKEKITAQ